MKIKLLIIALLPLLILGCEDLFDKGDVEKVYDGPPQVEFFPLQQEVSLADGSATVEVQLIGEQQSSDLSVNFNVNGESSTAEAGVHYNIVTSSPVTISSGTSEVVVEIELIEGSLEAGEEVELYLDLEGADGAEAAPNLDQALIYIQG